MEIWTSPHSRENKKSKSESELVIFDEKELEDVRNYSTLKPFGSNPNH